MVSLVRDVSGAAGCSSWWSALSLGRRKLSRSFVESDNVKISNGAQAVPALSLPASTAGPCSDCRCLGTAWWCPQLQQNPGLSLALFDVWGLAVVPLLWALPATRVCPS